MLLKYITGFKLEDLSYIDDYPELYKIGEEHFKKQIEADRINFRDPDMRLENTLAELDSPSDAFEELGKAYIKAKGLTNAVVDVNWHPTDDAEQCWFLTIYEVIPESYEELVGLVKSYQNTYGAGEILPEIIVDKIIKDS